MQARDAETFAWPVMAVACYKADLLERLCSDNTDAIPAAGLTGAVQNGAAPPTLGGGDRHSSVASKGEQLASGLHRKGEPIFFCDTPLGRSPHVDGSISRGRGMVL